jgi:hypothetical protein
MLRVEEVRAAGPSTPVNLTVMLHGLSNSIVARAAFGKKRRNAAEFMAAIKAGVGLSSGFCVADLFPTWTTVLAKVTGMKRSLQDIHQTVDSILQEIINERKAVRDEKIKSGAENLVDVLIALQERRFRVRAHQQQNQGHHTRKFLAFIVTYVSRRFLFVEKVQV